MMDLIKYEIYKVYKQKVIWIVMGLVFIASLVISTQMIGSDLKPSFKKIEGDLTQEKLELAHLDDARILKEAETSGNLTIEDENMRDAYEKLFYAERYLKVQPIKIKDALNDAKKANSEYEKQALELKADMLSDIQYRSLEYQRPMEQALLYIVTGSLTLILIYIILAVSQTYTIEYTSGMSNYLLSSTNGRRKTLFAKLIAHWILIAFIVLISTISAVILWGFYDGFSGWNSPLQSIDRFYESPYQLTIGQFIIITALMQFLIAMTLSTLITCISLLTKNVLQSFALTLLIIIAPITIGPFIPLVFVPDKLLLWLNFAPSVGLNTTVFFKDFQTINFLGYPILLPIVMCFIMLLLLVIFTLFASKSIQIKKI